MNVNEMLKLIAVKLGNRGEEEMAEFGLPYFKLKQAELEADPFLPWFLRKEDQASVGEFGQAPLPGDFIKVAPQSGVWFSSGGGDISEVCMVEPREAIAKYGTRYGIPVAYSLGTNSITVYPSTDSGILFFEYFAKQPELDEGTLENEWTRNAPWYIMAAVGLEVAQDLEHAPGVQFFAQKLEAAREMLFRMDADRAISGQRLTF